MGRGGSEDGAGRPHREEEKLMQMPRTTGSALDEAQMPRRGMPYPTPALYLSFPAGARVPPCPPRNAASAPPPPRPPFSTGRTRRQHPAPAPCQQATRTRGHEGRFSQRAGGRLPEPPVLPGHDPGTSGIDYRGSAFRPSSGITRAMVEPPRRSAALVEGAQATPAPITETRRGSGSRRPRSP